MLQQPRYIQNAFSVAFPRQERIRRHEYEFLEKLSDKYLQPNVIPVPDDFDPRVPRLIFGSRHSYSQISISQVAFSLNVTYSPEWQIDVAQRQDYLRSRVNVLFDLLSIVDAIQPYFCGLTTTVEMQCDDTDKDIVARLSHLFLKGEHDPHTHDIHIRRSSVVEGKFFSNTVIENYRTWQSLSPLQLLEMTPLPNKEVIGKGLRITGDFNDRYAFNENESYQSTQEIALEITGQAVDHLGVVIQKIQEGI